jgi:hypothetical protein
MSLIGLRVQALADLVDVSGALILKSNAFLAAEKISAPD